jgi:hypothetical protein
MALISDLVSAIADVEGVPEATVALAARYAREAGFLSQGARGRNAPRATVADCANLLIAVNASGCLVKDAPQAIEIYRRLRLHVAHGGRSERLQSVEYQAIEHDELRFLRNSEGRSFGEVLEAIIERFIGGELETFMMGEASKYLHEPFYEKAAEDLGNNAKAVAERVVDSCRRLLRLGTVRFDISFHRPAPYAELTVSRSVGSAKETLAGASFIISDEDLDAERGNSGGDRRDVTSIGYATFMKIAEVMRE